MNKLLVGAIVCASALMSSNASAVDFKVIFPYGLSKTDTICYRIPAIATVGTTGRLIAINDYRYCGADIGYGRIDLYQSVSDNGGKSWTKPGHLLDAQGQPVAEGTGLGDPKTSNEHRDAGFGDAAIVGDRESSKVLLMSVCGHTPFWASVRDIPQGVARWTSDDGGKTWSHYEDITEHIYSQFDNNVPNGVIDALFFGSGRIFQSAHVKVGDYYRLYAVLVGRHQRTKINTNWVMYSDDFGASWHVLGNPMTPPVPEYGDEPKAEELPDGSVLVSARTPLLGREFNIFRYTDITQGQGYWGRVANSKLTTVAAACNGEVMIVPARDNKTGEKLYVCLQSAPLSGSNERSHVGFSYKPLRGYKDFGTPQLLAANWEGQYIVCEGSSGYSTMTLQKDGKIAFLFEDERTPKMYYTGVYCTLSLDEITGGAYSYVPDTDLEVATALTIEVVKARLEAATNPKSAGYVEAATTRANIERAGKAYLANPTDGNYATFNRVCRSF